MDIQTAHLTQKDFIKTICNSLQVRDPLWCFPEQNLEIRISEINERSLHFACALEKIDVKSGDFIGISLGNNLDFITALFASFHLGVVAVPLKPLNGNQKENCAYIDKIQKKSSLKTIVYDSETEPESLSFWKKSTGEKAYNFNELHSINVLGTNRLQSEICGSKIALIQYSSGSTGTPKGVIITWDMVIKQVCYLHSVYQLHNGYSAIPSMSSWLPFYHDMGLFMGIIYPLYFNADNFLASPRYFLSRPVRWFQHISDRMIDVSFTTNSAMSFSLRKLEMLPEGTLNLSRVHLFFGAEKISPFILRRTIKILGLHGLRSDRVFAGYGMAENALGATSTINSAPKIVHAEIDISGNVSIKECSTENSIELVSCGLPYNGVSITIRDENDKCLDELKIGEISIQGPCVTPGYINDPENSSNVIPMPGRLLTRDLGFIYNNEVYFYARKDDMIIIGGRNVIPDDIEMAVEEFDYVKSGTSVLIGVENKIDNNTDLHLLVESRNLVDTKILNEQRIMLRKSIIDSFGILINNIHFCNKNTVEKTSSGKKRRKIVKELFMKNEIEIF